MSKLTPFLLLTLAGACSSPAHPPELGALEHGNFPPSTDDAAAAQVDAGVQVDAASNPVADAAGAADAPAGLPSNQCSQGTVSISSAILNPGDVYLDGTLSEGACYLDALTHWSYPYRACTGFDCSFDGSSAVIRPTDGRLLYINTFENKLREFHEDVCVGAMINNYPTMPLANDKVIPTPMCDPDSTFLSLSFRVSPEGDIYYSCSQTWYDLTGATVFHDGVDRLQNVGRNRVALVGQSTFRLVDLGTGALTELVPQLPVSSSLLAVRARDEGGFWIAVRLSSGPSDVDLWQVNPDGTAARFGSFPPIPATVTSAGAAAIDGCGALIQMGEGRMVFEDLIMRREMGGASAVVYDEAMMPAPLVKIHISYLITGP